MPNEAKELRSKLLSEAEAIRAERGARQRRLEILQVAGHIAGSLAAAPGATSRKIADTALYLAALIVDGAAHV